MRGKTRHIINTLLHPDVWNVVEGVYQGIKRLKISSLQLLAAIENASVRQAVVQALINVATQLLEHETALRNGARFIITVQNSDTS